MRYTTLTLLGSALALAFAGGAQAKQEKVEICHKGQTMSVPEPALGGHLGHGDSLGACAAGGHVIRQEQQVAVPAPAAVTTTTLYQYVFYPDAGVYFDAKRGLYFYPVNGQWQQAPTLPLDLQAGVQAGMQRSVTVEQAAPTPQNFHQEIVRQYGVASPPVPMPAQAAADMRQYLYYPANQVYFDPQRELYFYQVNGQWLKAPTLAPELRGALKDFETVNVQGDTPYLHHREILQRYAPPGAGMPPQAVSHYQFFPGADVYFDEAKRIYHYLANGQWQSAPTLPPSLQLDPQQAVKLDIDSDTPYQYHQQILQEYSTAAAAVGAAAVGGAVLRQFSVNRQMLEHSGGAQVIEKKVRIQEKAGKEKIKIDIKEKAGKEKIKIQEKFHHKEKGHGKGKGGKD